MKVLFICTLVTAVLGFDLDLDLEWKSYKESFNKLYTDKTEEKMRKILFRKKVLENKKHNDLFAAGVFTYEVGTNEYSDWTKEELGLLTPILPENGKGGSRFEYDSQTEVPAFFDWREQGAVTRVKRQGLCGSCYAFSAAGALEGALFLKKHVLIDLSVQDLVDCSGVDGNFGCSGGSPINCFNYVKHNFGINSNKTYPYEGVRRRCRFNPHDRALEISGYEILKTEQELKQVVALKGPVTVGIAIDNNLYGYKSGIINKPCRLGINHAVLVVGYGSENGTDYWIVKNSWGHRWGEEGFFRMVRNQDLCYITYDMSYPVL